MFRLHRWICVGPFRFVNFKTTQEMQESKETYCEALFIANLKLKEVLVWPDNLVSDAIIS